MDPSAISEALEQIPFTVDMGVVVEHASKSEVCMTLSDKRSNQNMVGIVHAGALFTFGETVAGIAAGFDTLDKAFPLARNASIEYKRPARGDIRATAVVPGSESDRVVTELDRDGRSELDVIVSLEDTQGEQVAEMNVHYSFRPREKR
ncbi:MAG: YiiD C-terminal domain-containing protein [Myxococcota bacterium]|nr:YiiD C-terminal domain-containing protein [Myxococcota bacterium]